MTIAVFASGSGSNFERLVDVSREEQWSVPIKLLICDQPEAEAVQRAERLGIACETYEPSIFTDKAEYERQVLEKLQKYNVTWLVLAGYMRLIGPTLLHAFACHIVNVHPSLLPAFPGLDAVGQALAHGVKVTGVTVHFVDEGVDTGPIIAQRAVEVSETDDHRSLTKKIQTVEHQLYPYVVRLLMEN